MAIAFNEWEIVDHVCVCLATEGDWEQGNFERWCKALDTGNVTAFMGFAKGTFMPTSAQRKASAEIFKRRGIRAVAITDNPLVRGVVTAVGWMGANVKAYAWSTAEKSFDFIDVNPSQGERIMQAVRRLEETEAAHRKATA